MYDDEEYGISDDEETQFAKLYPSGEVPTADMLWIMNIVEENKPEHYRAAMQLDWNGQRRSTRTRDCSRVNNKPPVANFVEPSGNGGCFWLDICQCVIQSIN